MSVDSPLLNPYHDLTFGSFLIRFFMRLGEWISGELSFEQLASDEIQVLVLAGVAISSAWVGTFLILRRMTMLANSISHTLLMGIVLAFFLSPHTELGSAIAPMSTLLFAALIMGFITAFLTEFLTKTAGLQEDASTGFVFTGLFAIGVILVTVLTRDAHIGTEAVMGDADALHPGDLIWVYLIVAINGLLFSLFFKEFALTTFDSRLATAMGFSPFIFNYLLMAQVSATTITSFRAVGVLLVLAFMTGPPLSARLWTHRLSSMFIGGAAIGSTCALVGVALTRHLLTVYGIALSTSGVVVCTLLAVYLLTAAARALESTIVT